MRIDRPQLPSSKLLSAVRGNKNGYYRANNDGDYPSSPSKSSRAIDVRPLLLDVKEWEHSKPVDCESKKTKTKKVVVKKIMTSPPSPSQRSMKRGAVARRIDAIENGQQCDDDDDDDDDSRYLLSSTKPANASTSTHQPKKSLLGFRLGSPRNNETISTAVASNDSVVKGFRILQQTCYRDVDETKDGATEVVDLVGFDVLGAETNHEDETEAEAVASFSSDKENGVESFCEVDVADDAGTITANLVAGTACTTPTETASDTNATPRNNDNLVANEASILHTPIIDESVAKTTTTVSYVTHATKYSNYHRVDNQEKPFHVTVTPTEDGDVILLSASTNPLSHRSTATTNSTLRNESTLMIPSLGGRDEADEMDGNDQYEQIAHEVQARRQNEEIINNPGEEEVSASVNVTPVEPESRKKFVSFSNEDKETSSPTGVDELDFYQEVETLVQEIERSISDDFVANEGWEEEEEEDDSNTHSSTLSRPFGSFEVHEDAMRDNRTISTFSELQYQHQEQHQQDGQEQHQLQQLQNHHVIELRHSMESDCDGESQSSSSYLNGADLLGSDTESIELKQLSDGGDDEVVEEVEDDHNTEKDNTDGNCPGPFMSNDDAVDEDSSKKGTRLGAFSQIYTREGQLPDGEESDSECDESDEFVDHNSVCTSKKSESIDVVTDDTPESSGEVSNGDVIEKTSLRHFGGSKPWALAECDSESVYSGADLISVPSKASLASSEDQEIAPSSSMLSADPHSVSTGDRDSENFESLNSFWVREWTEAVTKLTTEAGSESNEVPCKASRVDNVTREPRLLSKRDVGNAMTDDDIELGTSSNYDNICSDGEGNQYLKIYDIDTCTNVCEVIQLSGHELETVVEECSSEEDVEREDDEIGNDKHRDEKSLLLERLLEDTVEFEMQKLVGPQHKEHQTVAPTLEELQRLFDEYQVTQCNQFNGSSHKPPSPSASAPIPFRSVRSTKKRHAHIKRRAIAKAKAEKTKYDLVYVEKGSHRDKSLHSTCSKGIVDFPESSSTASHSSLGTNVSLDSILLNAINTRPELPRKDEDRQLSIHYGASEEDQSSEHNLASSESFEFCVPIDCNVPELEEQKSDIKFMHSIDEDNSLGLGSNMSLDGIISKAVRTMPEFSFENNDCEVRVDSEGPKMELGDNIEEENSMASSVSLDSVNSKTQVGKWKVGADNYDHDTKSEMKTIQGQFVVSEGAASVLAKLYDENNELAESLATVQRELESVNRKLAVVTNERDEVLSSARIEV